MIQPQSRSRLTAVEDPNQKLTALLGPAFAGYRQAFSRAEAGERPEFPLHLDVDVTTACNFHCPMCPAGNSGHIFPGFKKGLFLKPDLYEKALVEGAGFGLPSLRLGVTGEPLLRPDIDQWVSRAKKAKVLDISLITNGRLLTPSMSRRLIKAGLTRLMISVDAAGPETYKVVRPGGDWAELMANIEDFLAARRESASPLPLLRLSFVEMSLNQADRASFEARFAPLADYLSFQRYQNILGRGDTDFKLPGQAGASLSGRCSEPLTRLALHADGGLFPCCSDFGRLKPLANLEVGGLLATWQSEAAWSLTRSGSDQVEPCSSCLHRLTLE